MSASPQPPHPPAPPAPPAPHTGSYVLAIILLILAMMVAASVAALWFGIALIRHTVHVQVTEQAGHRKEVQIQTPVGNLEVRKGEQANETQLGLPFYPGATRVEDEHDVGSVGLSLNFPGENDVRIYVGAFQSSDALIKVREFYARHIGDEMTKYTVKDKEGKIIFDIKEKDQQRVVALEPKDGGTRITLVRVLHAKAEAN